MLGAFFPKHQLMKLFHLAPSMPIQLLCTSNFYHSKGSLYYANSTQNKQCEKFLSTSVIKDSAVQRIKEKVSSMTRVARVKIAACLVYETTADSMNFVEFIKYFELPDTFQSWFLLIQLHVWMCVSITISEKQGRLFRNSLIESMWSDVELRIGQVTTIPSAEKKRCLRQIVEQFRACLISYDEGILSNDVVLAATVWRTLFNFQDVHPKLLESMVLYIRKQMYHLDSLPMDDILQRGSIYFLPLENIVQSISNEKYL